MNPHAPESTHIQLKSLEYPNSFIRCVEAVAGSARRDALRIIRTAMHSQFELREQPVPTVTISTPEGRVIFQGEKCLEAVHINTPHGSLHLSGACGFAERLARFAARALLVAHERLKEKCLSAVREACLDYDSSKTLGCDYSMHRTPSKDLGNYSCWETERGSVTTQEGTITLTSHYSHRWAHIDGHWVTTPEGPMFIPPPPSTRDEVRASFVNEEMRGMFKVLGEETYPDSVDLSNAEIRQILVWARDNKDRPAVSGSDVVS